MMKIHFGIIGFGAFAEKRLLPAFRQCQHAKLVAIHKRNPDAAEEKAKQYQIPYFYHQEEQLLDNPEIDAVFIASPNALHHPHTILAAQHGKHVLCEKPMALNSRQAEKMIHSCQKHGVQLMVAHMLRFARSLQQVQTWIANNIIGGIKMAVCHFSLVAGTSPRQWLYDAKLAGGGTTMDIGVHCFDTLRYVLDDDVVEIQALLWPLSTSIDMNAQIGLRFSRGVLATIQVSFELPYQSFLEVRGSGGTIRAFNFSQNENIVELVLQTDTDKIYKSVANGNFYAAEIDNFAQALLQDRPNPIPGEEGLQNQRVLDAVYQIWHKSKEGKRHD